MLVHPHQKSLYQFEGNFQAYPHTKNELQPTFLLRYSKEIANLYFGQFGHAWPNRKCYYKFKKIIYWQKIDFILRVFLEIIQEY